MPAVVSHYLLAKKVLFTLQQNGMYIPCPEAFLLGASGPDIFFAHRVMPWQKQKSMSGVSHIMHGSGAAGMLNLMHEYALQSGDDKALSYTYGFVTHYAFDSLAHPYIVGRSLSAAGNKKAPLGVFSRVHPKVNEGLALSSIYHNKIEAELDSAYLMKEMHLPIRRFKMKKTCPANRDTVNSCAGALAEYIKAAGIDPYPEKKEIARAFYDWRRALILLNDRTLIKGAAMKRAEKALGLPPALSVFFRSCYINTSRDCANLSHSTWYSSVDGSAHTDTFFELADKAHDYSLELIMKLCSGAPLTPDDCPESFSAAPRPALPAVSGADAVLRG